MVYLSDFSSMYTDCAVTAAARLHRLYSAANLCRVLVVLCQCTRELSTLAAMGSNTRVRGRRRTTPKYFCHMYIAPLELVIESLPHELRVDQGVRIPKGSALCFQRKGIWLPMPDSHKSSCLCFVFKRDHPPLIYTALRRQFIVSVAAAPPISPLRLSAIC